MVACLGVVECLDDCPAAVHAEGAANNASVTVSVIIQKKLDSIQKTGVNGNQKCSDFGNSECSIFGIKTTVLLASAAQ